MISNFGTHSSGETVKAIDLRGGGLTARIITWGATVQDLRLAGHEAPLVLGLDTVEAYEKHRGYFGATVGRFGNRIGGARFELDGHEYKLAPNEGGNQLHGGPDCFAYRNWSIMDSSDSHVTIELVSPDGDQGYPGTLVARCRYSLEADGALRVFYSATSDMATVCNLTNHSYFNLEDGGASDISAHKIRIKADHVLELRDDLIPTGELIAVGGTFHDLRSLTPIGDFNRFDVNYCLANRQESLRTVAEVSAPSSGVTMTVDTTEPGIQFYGGLHVRPAMGGRNGRGYKPGAALCLEAQCWPDAPNHAHFPDCILRPGQEMRQDTIYRFTKST